MSINGGVKFLNKSEFLFTGGARAFSIRGGSAQEILNHSRLNGFLSTGSDDTILEQIVIDLTESKKINRFILNQHNFKDIEIYFLNFLSILKEDGFNLLKEDGGMLYAESATGFLDQQLERFIAKEDDFLLKLENGAHFKLEQFNLNVNEPVSILKEDGFNLLKEDGFKLLTEGFVLDTDSGLQLKIQDVDVDTSTSYYEFDQIQCSRIVIQCKTTQIPNQQKSLKAAIGTTEIGTLEGFPTITNSFDRNIRRFRMLGNKNRMIKGPESFSSNLTFKNYPGQNDIDLIETLQDVDEDFLIWLSGGREGSNYFTYDTRGFEIDDIYLVQVSTRLPISYTNSIYVNPYNTSMGFSETVG